MLSSASACTSSYMLLLLRLADPHHLLLVRCSRKCHISWKPHRIEHRLSHNTQNRPGKYGGCRKSITSLLGRWCYSDGHCQNGPVTYVLRNSLPLPPAITCRISDVTAVECGAKCNVVKLITISSRNKTGARNR